MEAFPPPPCQSSAVDAFAVASVDVAAFVVASVSCVVASAISVAAAFLVAAVASVVIASVFALVAAAVLVAAVHLDAVVVSVFPPLVAPEACCRETPSLPFDWYLPTSWQGGIWHNADFYVGQFRVRRLGQKNSR